MNSRLQETPEAELSASARQAADLAAFRRMLQVSKGTFSLSFAVCDDRNLRDSLIQRFCSETPGILVVRLPAGVESVLRVIEQQLPTVLPAAVFILDMEASIPHGSDTQPALRVLNSSREHWEALCCPVVFWLADYAMTLVHSHAPDFWRYRSHQFEFVPESTPLSKLKAETFSGYPMLDALHYEEKAFRIIELERRLREAGDPPSVDMLPHALTWSYELAYLYRHANRFSEAEERLERALDWAETIYGSDHSYTGNTLVNLAELLRAMNRLGEAETLHRRALAIDEGHYGPNHAEVAIDLNNLASTLLDADRLVEAEPLYRRALGIDESHYGPDHPSVARGLNNLATLMKVTNRLVEAEPLYRRALGIDENSYGPDHPNVARDLNNLATLLNATNRSAEAEPLYRRALGIDENSYGPDHPNVAIRLNNLALLLQGTKRLEEAEPLMRRALGTFVASLGPEHPNSQTAWSNYIELLQDMGLEEAEIQKYVQAAIVEKD